MPRGQLGPARHRLPLTVTLLVLATKLSVVQAQDIEARFLPPEGTRLLAVMKTLNELDDSSFWRRQPGAVVTYTDLRHLSALSNAVDSPTGRLHADALVARFPNSALIVGLHVAGSLEQIAAGELDAQIDRLNSVLAGYRRPVYLRFGYEFDGAWNGHEPELFVAAWRRFYKRISRGGARHIAMVWQSAAYCGATFQNRPVSAWYPGDAYVDWVGLSYFRASDCGGLLPEGIVNFARQRGKPVMISEATPRGYDLAGRRFSNDGKTFTPLSNAQIWAEWYAPLFAFMDRNADVVRAMTYIDFDWQSYPMWAAPPGPSYWGDSRLDSNAYIRLRWRLQLTWDRWLWANPRLFADLGYRAH